MAIFLSDFMNDGLIAQNFVMFAANDRLSPPPIKIYRFKPYSDIPKLLCENDLLWA